MQVGERLLIKFVNNDEPVIEEVIDFSDPRVRLSDGAWYDKHIIMDMSVPITDYIKENPNSIDYPKDDVIFWKKGMKRPIYGKINRAGRFVVDFARTGPFYYFDRVNHQGNRAYTISITSTSFVFQDKSILLNLKKEFTERKPVPNAAAQNTLIFSSQGFRVHYASDSGLCF